MEIDDNLYYAIMWKPKHELRVVDGKFVKKHPEECKPLGLPYESKKLLKLDLKENRAKYLEEYDD